MRIILFLILLVSAGFLIWKYADLPSSLQKNEQNTSVHIVKKGDTLSSISRKYDVSIPSLKRNNHLSSDTITIGQKLKLKSNTQTKASKPSTASVQSKKATPKKVSSASPKKALRKKELPKNVVMENARIAIDIDSKNQVYLKNKAGKFVPAGTIIYDSKADSNGLEIKTITFRDLQGKETTLPANSADAELVIRTALKK